MTDEVNTEVKSEIQAEAASRENAVNATAPETEAVTGNGEAAVAATGDEAAEAVLPAVVLARIEQLQQEVQTNLTGWQRERADFANYKRRTDKEIKEARERGALDAITRMLPIIDDFERALQNIPADLENHPWVSGTALILKKFDRVLDEFSVVVIDPVGQPFDPHHHEAIGTDPDSEQFASGHVTVTLQKGYASGDRVLRPALVRVAG